MARRRRDKRRTAKRPGAEPKPVRMARVYAADDVWADFRNAAQPYPIARALGMLVEREVDRYRARRAREGALDDQEMLDALERARELHERLALLVSGLERRLDRRPS